MDSLYYSGFNGFKQVPHLSALHLSTLVQQQQNMDCAGVRDVAVCWNYLVVVDDVGVVTKFGLVRGRNGQERLEDLPKAAGKVVQLSATPRHIMVCTDKGGKNCVVCSWKCPLLKLPLVALRVLGT